MEMKLILSLRLSAEEAKVFTLDNINLENKVSELRDEAAKKTNFSKDSFELVYCGCTLEDDTTLESCGLKNGSMVHLLKRKITQPPAPTKVMSDIEITQLTNAFRSFNENPALRSALHRLSKRPEVIENIISSSPGLSEDAVAIAMLQDPDLMAHFTDPETVKRISEHHPLLVEAAQHISTAVHEEAHNSAIGNSDSSRSNGPSTAYSYSLDNLSDDEEMAADSSQSSDSAMTSSMRRFPSNSGITAAQLAAALSRAGTRGFPSNSSSSSSIANRNSGVITAEMFSQAMQQAFASTPGTTSSSTLSTPPPPPTPQSVDVQRQLAQMHEIGLLDDAVNLQALHVTNGDVQAAIELVFSGFSDN